ncbi:SCO family protein [Devosia sp.]|uniref:SCO family protein n=1 Tax=Devosia sp. TaxID=1871048 RepID=UPI003263D51F
MANLKTVRIWLWVAVVALALTAGTAFLLLRNAPGTQAGFGGGQYALLDGNNQPVNQTVFNGHPSMLFFGFTHCPDVCPTTMAEMASWFEQLGDAGKPLRGYFVSVDPERDTPAVLGDYVGAVSDRITGLTGKPEEVAKIIKAWHIYAQKVPGENGDYSMDHTATVFLLNSKGEFEGTIAYQEDSRTALEKLRNLLAKT